MKTKGILKTAKVLVLLFGFLGLYGCEKEETTEKELNPPTWIHGTWEMLESGKIFAYRGYKFTSNDVIPLYIDTLGNINQAFTFKEMLNTASSEGNFHINETNVSHQYKLDLVNYGKITDSYNFLYDTDSTIILELTYSHLFTTDDGTYYQSAKFKRKY